MLINFNGGFTMGIVKRRIGAGVARIGSALWEANGFWKDVAHTETRKYEDLKWYGKLGYNMCVKGCMMMFATPEDFEEAATIIVKEYEKQKAENL
jgi:hypothetical protein